MLLRYSLSIRKVIILLIVLAACYLCSCVLGRKQIHHDASDSSCSGKPNLTFEYPDKFNSDNYYDCTNDSVGEKSYSLLCRTEYHRIVTSNNGATYRLCDDSPSRINDPNCQLYAFNLIKRTEYSKPNCQGYYHYFGDEWYGPKMSCQPLYMQNFNKHIIAYVRGSCGDSNNAINIHSKFGIVLVTFVLFNILQAISL